jgi:GNAT superfamily N-acetyltransferase
VEAIERATLAGVAPAETLEIGGFLAGLDAGPIGRARTAVPLRHDLPPDEAVLDEIEAAYVTRGLPPAFRVADVEGLEPLAEALRRRGYAPHTETLVKVAATADVAALDDGRAELVADPDADWQALFVGVELGREGDDSAGRMAALRRARLNRFAAVRAEGACRAVGVGSFAPGCAGVHGMRTDLAARRRGYAASILGVIASEARRQDAPTLFLQVLEANAPARSVYRKAGFTLAWRYAYWNKAG